MIWPFASETRENFKYLNAKIDQNAESEKNRDLQVIEHQNKTSQSLEKVLNCILLNKKIMLKPID